MESVLDMPLGLKYEERIMLLNDSGIGLWDVLLACERKGSLDSRIVDSSELYNDFSSLFLRYDNITDIACNGKKAYETFTTRIAPLLDKRISQRLTIIKLPSTSPAHASCGIADLAKAWSILKTILYCKQP
jgi:hypoxanthine-DNA glycosylase